MYKILAVLFSLATLVAPGAARADTITLAADPWCPYNCEPNSTQPGIMVEIAQAILGLHGHEVVYSTRPWKRCIHDAVDGTVSGVIGATRSDAPNLIFPDCDMIDYVATFYVRRGNPWRYAGTGSLEGKRLGVVAGYSYGPETDAYIQAHADRVHESDGEDACAVNLNQLAAGRLDVALEDPQVVAHLRGHFGFLQSLEPAGTLPPRDMTIAFSPRLPQAREYAALLCQGLKTLRASGGYARILGKYGIAVPLAGEETNAPDPSGTD